MPDPFVVYTFVGRRWSEDNRPTFADQADQPTTKVTAVDEIPCKPGPSETGIGLVHRTATHAQLTGSTSRALLDGGV